MDTDLSKASGLSPRVRGNLPFGVHEVVVLRSIPACAGEPSEGSPGAESTTVYPRVCGGTINVKGTALTITGLSPRVRGNPLEMFPAVVVLIKVGWGLFCWVGWGCEWGSSGSASGL